MPQSHVPFLIFGTLLSIFCIQSQQTLLNFDGTYIVTSIKTKGIQQDIQVDVSNQTINIYGCNSVSIAFLQHENTQYVFDLIDSTQLQCPGSDVPKLVTAIKQSKFITVNQTNLLFLNGKQEYVRMKTVKLQALLGAKIQNHYTKSDLLLKKNKLDLFKSRNALPQNKIFSLQNYNLLIAPLGLDINESTLILYGCNRHQYKYIRKQTGQVQLTFLLSTFERCQIDIDFYYQKALIRTTASINHGKGYNFFDDSGRTILQILKIQDLLKGQFQISFPTVELLVDQYYFKFRGCNTHYFSYQTIDDLISFEKERQTFKSCSFYDYDKLISSSFQAANFFKINEKNQIQLKNNDKILLIANLSSTQNQEDQLNPNFISPLFFKYAKNNNANVLNQFSLQLSNNNIPISLRGFYKMEMINNDIAIVIVQFDDSYIQFEGCNIVRIPYVAYKDGLFNLLDGGSSTNRTCIINNDQIYLKALVSTKIYNKTASGYIFSINEEQQLISLVTNVRNNLVKSQMLNGVYDIQLAGVDITISDNKIKFSGCNTHIIPLNSRPDGTVFFSSNISTQRPCQNDTDQYYLKSIFSSKSIKYVPEGLSFVDQNGFERIKLLDYLFATRSSLNPYDGRYKAQLSNAGIRLKINNGQFTLSGCNQFTFKFSIYDAGDITFGPVSTIFSQCKIQNDVVFLYSILKTRNIAVSKNTLLFVNSQNQMIVKGTNNDLSISEDIPFTTALNTKNSQRYYFRAGAFKLIFMRTSLANYNITINSQMFIFSGCNTYTIPYNAFYNGTIKFRQGNSTKRLCVDNYDNLFIEGFLSIRTFIDQAGTYTLFNQYKNSIFNIIPKNGNIRPLQILLSSPKPPVNNQSKLNLTQIATNSGAPLMQSSTSTDTPLLFLSQLASPPNYRLSTTNSPIKSLKGYYRGRLPQISLTISNDSFIIKGCNSYRIPYKINKNQIIFGKQLETKSECQFDNARHFVALLSQIKSFRKINKTVYFYTVDFLQVFSANILYGKQFFSRYVAPQNLFLIPNQKLVSAQPAQKLDIQQIQKLNDSQKIISQQSSSALPKFLNSTLISSVQVLSQIKNSTIPINKVGNQFPLNETNDSKSNSNSTNKFQFGVYQIKMPLFLIEANDYQFKIFNCDVDILQYEARQSGFITIKRDQTDKLNDCQYKQRNVIKQHIYSSSSFVRKDENNFVLRDIKGYPRVFLQVVAQKSSKNQ